MDVKPGLAAYRRVVEAIKGEIESGRLPAGAKLPGNRALAEQYEVALGTLQKALKVLQDEGWLIATPAVGVFVNEPQSSRSDVNVSMATIIRQLDDLQATVDALGERMRRLEEARGS
jgi:GntR family transcriptional regulator